MALFGRRGNILKRKIPPIFSWELDTDGDGTGTKNANGDYSSAAEEFYREAASDQILIVSRMLVHIRDNGSWQAERYGSINNGLTNGVEVSYTRHGVTQDLTDGDPVVSNAHWARLCYDVTIESFGSGDTFGTVRWTFEKAGVPLMLLPGDKISVTLNDNLSSLVDHRFTIQGYVL